MPQISDKELKLTGPVIAEIFMGKIIKWNDAKIKESNPDLDLPAESMYVVHRSDALVQHLYLQIIYLMLAHNGKQR